MEDKICAGCFAILKPRLLLTSFYYECAHCASRGDSGSSTAVAPGEEAVLPSTSPLPIFVDPPGDMEFTDWADCYACKNAGCEGCMPATWSVY